MANPQQRRLKLIVQYDGADFQGWQIQPDGPSIQQTIEEALGCLVEHPVRVQAAGRTDSGVHALAMPVQFETVHPIPAANLPVALAKYLPDAISVLSAAEVAPDFDVRRKAILRWYRYQILLSPMRRPLGPRAWVIHRPLDLDAIYEGQALLAGEHDFQGFRSSQCQARRTRLTLEQATLTQGKDLIALDFKCRSFLQHMIRLMVGSLVAMGQGQLSRERLLRIRDTGDRPQLILCAPPQGLCLMGVAYDEEERRALLEACPRPPSF